MPIEVLAAMNYVHLLASLGDWDWRQWVLDRYPIDLQKKIGPHRELAFAFVDPLLRWERLRDDPAAPTLFAAWEVRARAAGRYRTRVPSALDSVLHLHANRLIGLDRDAEHLSYGILRAVVRQHLGQLRNAR